MNERTLDLSKLTNFLINTITSTKDVRNILKSQCDEAKFALAPWQLETITRRELDENSCTCMRGILSSEDHVKEIAIGIDRAVSQARKLREKLASNILEEKKLARGPNVQQIYASGSKSLIGSRIRLMESSDGGRDKSRNRIEDVGERIDGRNSHQKNNKIGMKEKKETEKTEERKEKEKTSLTGNEMLKRDNDDHDDRDISIRRKESHRSCSNLKKTLDTRIKINDKKLVGTSPYNPLVAAFKGENKSKGRKNFIAANKSSIKNMRTNPSKTCLALSNSQKQVSENSQASKSSDSLISRAQSAAEFDNLISKISLESENGILKSTSKVIEANGCPLHDKNAPKFIEEKINTSLDVAEGLDRFGVPSELVKILKVYHSYLNEHNQSISKPKGDKSETRFLQEFDLMNRERRKLSNKNKLDNVCNEFLTLFKDSYNKKIDFIELSRLKIRYTDLDSSFKSLEMKKNISPTKRKVSNMIENRKFEINRSWKLNSVWNEACISNLEGMSSARIIKYANKNQLLELFKLVQEIQRIKYQNSLVDLLINEVLPAVRNSFEPNSEEFVNAFKMISIISNLLYLKVPVLVRTDK